MKDLQVHNEWGRVSIRTLDYTSAKHLKKRFDHDLITCFNSWLTNGKSQNNMIALATSVETVRKEPQTETPKSHNLPSKQITFNTNQQINSTQLPAFDVIALYLSQDIHLRNICVNLGGGLFQRIWMLFLKKKYHHQNQHLKNCLRS